MNKKNLLPQCGALLLLMVFCGCSSIKVTTAPVSAGEQVAITYSCRLADGSLAASNQSDEVTANLPKSKIYFPLNKKDPVPVVAGKGLRDDKPASIRSFEDEIAVQLAKKLSGLPTGVTSRLAIRGDGSLTADGLSHKLSMATVWKRPKEIHLDRAKYLAKSGTEPREGQIFNIDPLIPGKVAAVKGDDVLVKATAIDGSVVATAFGPGRIREAAENIEVVLSPQLGSLIRTGPIVGGIREVNDKNFIADFSDLFAGEVLSCDVLPERLPVAQEEGTAHAGK